MVNEETQELNPNGRIELKNIIDSYQKKMKMMIMKLKMKILKKKIKIKMKNRIKMILI